MTIFLPEGKRENIVAVNFNRRSVTDESVQALTRLPHLERLYMEHARISDEQVREIAKIKTLRRLALWQTGVTDAGAMSLATLPNLEIANLRNTNVTWRTELEFQEKSAAKIISSWRRRVTISNRQDFHDFARLEKIVARLNIENPTEDDLIYYLDRLQGEWPVKVFGNDTQLTKKAIKAIFDHGDVRLTLHGQHLPNKKELLKYACDLWSTCLDEISVGGDGGTFSFMVQEMVRLHFMVQKMVRLHVLAQELLDSHDLFLVK